MNELALFAGCGGGLLASKLLGWNTICAVEKEEYRQNVLIQRQKDGILEPFPIWDDVCSFDGSPWKGCVDIITGGFPCQDVSQAGKGAGVAAGKRSGLWRELARIIGEIQPPFAFIENVPKLVTRGLDIVLKDLAHMGYHARWCVLGAWHCGFPHMRDRIWILAYSNCVAESQRRECQISATEGTGGKNYRRRRSNCDHWQISSPPTRENEGSCRVLAANTLQERKGGCGKGRSSGEVRQRRKTVEAYVQHIRESPFTERNGTPQPLLLRGDHGLADWLDRIEAIGDGQVPLVAATAFLLLAEGLI